MKNLLLITLSYPYAVGGEATFLKEEVKRYVGHFNKIVLLPGRVSESREATADFLYLDHSLAEHTRGRIRFPHLLASLFDRPGLLVAELLNCLKKGKGLAALKAAFVDYLLTMSYSRFLQDYFRNKQNEQWLVYTYWFTPITNAVVLFGKNKNNIRVISRAHGIDLYEYRSKGYIPFREKIIKGLDKLVLVSDYGKKYILKTYSSVPENLLSTFGIGTSDTGITSKSSSPGMLSIVSCSNVDENKRLHLIVQGLKELSTQRPDIRLRWNHFGGGPLMEQIKTLASESLPAAVDYTFHGKTSNEEIMQFYRSQPVDIFLTTTASEGGRPVSIMEAMCCGIPVLATEVGGIPELVDTTNGILLSQDPNAEEIAAAFGKIILESGEERQLKKSYARKKWELMCNADSNFSEFTSYLSNL